MPGVSAHKWRKDKDFSLWLNDLERIVLDGWPVLRAALDGLAERGARVAMVSGSGSSVFGVFDDEATRDRARHDLARALEDWRLEAVRTVDRGATVLD